MMTCHLIILMPGDSNDDEPRPSVCRCFRCNCRCCCRTSLEIGHNSLINFFGSCLSQFSMIIMIMIKIMTVIKIIKVTINM